MTVPSGLVIVDKPAGLTSHDVVARIRRMAGTRRVGHAGTLDPMATGVLVVGVQKATRLLGHLALTEKEYAATIRLGQATDSGDADGQIVSSVTSTSTVAGRAAAELTAGEVTEALAAFTGEIQQVPPGISAIKVAGKRAYQLTREGAPPKLAARTVTVRELVLVAVRPAGDLLDADVKVTCSSGTYIRAIARDVGTALGVGGHLTALRRTRVGPYTEGMARSPGACPTWRQTSTWSRLPPPPRRSFRGGTSPRTRRRSSRTGAGCQRSAAGVVRWLRSTRMACWSRC